jgi:hypothetical protein
VYSVRNEGKWCFYKASCGVSGSDGRNALQRQDLGLVVKEFGAVGNNLRRNNVKISYLPHSQVHENLSQSAAEFLSLLSCEFIGRAKGSQNCVICQSKSQPDGLDGQLRMGEKLALALYNPRTGELDISKMLKVACGIIADTTG